MQVYLSRSETAEWGGDEAFRTKLCRDMAARAREKGRRMVAIYDSAGIVLAELTAA
jgi:hypothetical protein